MTRGCEGMTLGLVTGGQAHAGRSGVTALRLLATLMARACAPAVAGDVVRVDTIVPVSFLDAYLAWIRAEGAAAAAPPPRTVPDLSGAWSGVLLPVQREAARLLADLFPAVEVITPLPAGGLRLTVVCTLAMHDRMALWYPCLGLIADAFKDPAADGAGPAPITSLEPGVPQHLAGPVLDLYRAASPRAPGDSSAA